jgi:hypothetical protein
VISDNPTHAKVLQQLGWLHHQDESPFQNQDIAIQYLTQSLEAGKSRRCRHLIRATQEKLLNPF